MNKSKTAYDYRRVIALVQVLAANDFYEYMEGVLGLCEAWGVDVVERVPEGLTPDIMATTNRLAQHALEYSRKVGE